MADMPCRTCRMRQAYEKNPRSLMGRFWRWHTGWCPGWKAYVASLSDEERSLLQARLDALARRP